MSDEGRGLLRRTRKKEGGCGFFFIFTSMARMKMKEIEIREPGNLVGPF